MHAAGAAAAFVSQSKGIAHKSGRVGAGHSKSPQTLWTTVEPPRRGAKGSHAPACRGAARSSTTRSERHASACCGFLTKRTGCRGRQACRHAPQPGYRLVCADDRGGTGLLARQRRGSAGSSASRCRSGSTQRPACPQCAPRAHRSRDARRTVTAGAHRRRGISRDPRSSSPYQAFTTLQRRPGDAPPPADLRAVDREAASASVARSNGTAAAPPACSTSASGAPPATFRRQDSVHKARAPLLILRHLGQPAAAERCRDGPSHTPLSAPAMHTGAAEESEAVFGIVRYESAQLEVLERHARRVEFHAASSAAPRAQTAAAHRCG